MAVPKNQELRDLLDKFVCVRLVQMWGVDLSRFQCDMAMTWAAFFANADGTLYGRYGTRPGLRKNSARAISVAGFMRSLEATLALHARYTADRESTAREVKGKQTQSAPQWSRPELIPSLAKNRHTAKPFTAVAKERSLKAHGVGCIHCHMVQTAEIMSLRGIGKAIPEQKIWPYPMPIVIGLFMDPKERSTVRRVRNESIAAKAGLEPGDEILRLAGQTILSTADLQWVLHNADGDGAVFDVSFSRGGQTNTVKLTLPNGWRRRLGDWRFVNLGVCMQIAGFKGRPRGGRRRLAIQVQGVHRKRLAGVNLRRNDTIIAIDGKREQMNLGQLTQCLLDKKPGSKLELMVRRRGEEAPFKVELELR